MGTPRNDTTTSAAGGVRRLRIYYVIDYYDGPYAGTEKQLWLLIREMAARGHEVRLFVFRHTSYTRQARDFPCPIELCDVRKMLSLNALLRMRELRQRVLRERPDVVHAFFNDAAILVPVWCSTADTAVITSRRDLGFWYSKAILWGLRLANTRVSHIICNSEAVARVVAERERLDRSRLAVIVNALPLEDLQPATMAEIPRRRTGQPTPMPDPADVNVCLVANIRPLKRIDDFVQAAARVLQACPQSRFWIAGGVPDTPYARDLVDLPRRLGIQDRVTFIGRMDNPLQLVRHCQIGVLTSETEGLSNAIMEYMDCGLPVVCTDVGGNPELVHHDDNGYLFPVGGVAELGAHLVDLVRNPEKRAAMGLAGRQHARAFSVGAIVDEHERLYAAQ
ncbi:MAG: glycosyltransferase [Gammaproteobacteria bacterium]|jgi:glycosyltransferase involved in cell wall biosynthesis|nr:glycosyltransferase [Gammaproteobacteria bacterium]